MCPVNFNRSLWLPIEIWFEAEPDHNPYPMDTRGKLFVEGQITESFAPRRGRARTGPDKNRWLYEITIKIIPYSPSKRNG